MFYECILITFIDGIPGFLVPPRPCIFGCVDELRLLFLGDIVGKPGRELIRRGLPSLIERHNVDLVIANAENAAAGRGITREIGNQLLGWGIGVMTSGNHIWAQRETADYIGAEPRLLRPANFPAGVPGRGSYLAQTDSGKPVGVINVMGRVFMQELDNPFSRVLEEIETLRAHTRVILVDFHAEATSEKIAMGWHLDGKVTAVIGTHTHVQTADEQILPGGTAYLTDAGMTGPHDGVIGVEKAGVIDKFQRGMPVRMETASGNPRLNGLLIAADEATGRARSVQRISVSAKELDHELPV
jgi:2',3'-cyclic-nucleotide 2'-phosphodiesterase